MHALAECTPVYEELTGWEDLPPEEWRRIAANGFGALPKEAQAYVRWIEKELGAKLAFVSVGRGREDTIDLRKVAPPKAAAPAEVKPSRKVASTKSKRSRRG